MKIKIVDVALGVLILIALAMTVLAFTQVRGPARPLPWGGVRYDAPPQLPHLSIPSIFIHVAARRRGNAENNRIIA
jgi:hypothetical protein